jgi:hypothetical protein
MRIFQHTHTKLLHQNTIEMSTITLPKTATILKRFLLAALLSLSFVQPASATQKSLMEDAIFNYLHNNFNTAYPIFTFVGRVEITKAYVNSDGGYTVQGAFTYKNMLDLEVRRSFKADITQVLDEYSVSYFKFYTLDGNSNWTWLKV